MKMGFKKFLYICVFLLTTQGPFTHAEEQNTCSEKSEFQQQIDTALNAMGVASAFGACSPELVDASKVMLEILFHPEAGASYLSGDPNSIKRSNGGLLGYFNQLQEKNRSFI